MSPVKNKINKISKSSINTINQIGIEKQNNYLLFNSSGSNEIDRFMKMATSHDLFPYYMIDYKKDLNGKYIFYSKPTCEKSKEIYPINYKVNFTVVDDRFKDINDMNLLLDKIKYVDSPVEIRFNRFEKFLGDVKDPYPDCDLISMQEGKSYIMPKKSEMLKLFQNVDIKFDNSKFVLRNIKFDIIEQNSNSSYVLNNYKQINKSTKLKLNIEISNKKCDCLLNYKLNQVQRKNSKARLEYNRFCLNLLTKKSYLVDRNDNNSILVGKRNNEVDENILNSLKEYITILERIIEIEKFFKIKFNVPDEIEKDDVLVINKLYTYIKESKRKIRAFRLNIKLIKGKSDLSQLKNIVNIEHTSIMESSENNYFVILGEKLRISKIIQVYNDIKCFNIDEINNFIKNFDEYPDDYQLSITMVPAKGKYFYKTTEIIK